MMKIEKQVELFFVDPAVLKQSKTVIIGHVTSALSIPDCAKGFLTIAVNSDDSLKSIQFSEEIILPESERFYGEPELAFLNSPSLNDLMRNHQLRVFSDLSNSNIISEVMFLEVPALIEGLRSYLFFGFADVNNPLVKANPSVVFYTEKGEIKTGGVAPHRTGDHIGYATSLNYAFGFGRKMKMSCTTSKVYLEGMDKYKRMLSDPAEKNNPHIGKVFAHCMEEYLDHIRALNVVLEEEGKDYRPFWLDEALSAEHDELFNRAFAVHNS